jgi:hypothetical protein
MKEVSLAAFMAVICILLSSCAPIYSLTSKGVIQNEDLYFLKPGETTLAEIKEHLLEEPLARRNNGRLLLYKKNWSYWRELPASLYGYDDRRLDIDEFLIIEMDEDNKLKHYDVLPFGHGLIFPFSSKTKECTSWRLCLDMDEVLSGCIESLDDDASYTFLRPQVEQFELEHPPNGQCQIITYSRKGSGWGFRVQIDENPNRVISKKGFLRNIVAPGDHILTLDWSLCLEEPSGPIQKRLSCNSGESLFISVSGTRADFIPRASKLKIKIETADEALKIVPEKRLIID